MYRSLLPWGPAHQLAVSGTGLLVTGSGCITDSELIETTGTATASATLHDGSGDNGQILRDYTLLASQTTSEQWGLHWLPFVEGLYVHTLSGSVKGSITVWLDHKCEHHVNLAHRLVELEVLKLEFELASLTGA